MTNNFEYIFICLFAIYMSLLKCVCTSFSSFFWEIFLCSFVCIMFVSSFWLTPWVCFYVLHSSAVSPSIGRVVLHNRCSVRSNGAVFLITWARCSRIVSCVSVCAFLLKLSLDCYWNVTWWDWSSGNWLWGLARTTVCELLCRVWPHEMGLWS